MGHGEGVVAENFGRVVVGVDADTQQESAGQSRIRTELLVDFREVAADARAEVREGAARVDKSYEQNLAAILLERNSLAGLIGEREIGNVISGGGQIWRVRGCGRSGVAD